MNNNKQKGGRGSMIEFLLWAAGMGVVALLGMGLINISVKCLEAYTYQQEAQEEYYKDLEQILEKT